MLFCNPTNTAWFFTKSSIDVLCGILLCEIPLKLREVLLDEVAGIRKTMCAHVFIVFSLINFPGGDDLI